MSHEVLCPSGLRGRLQGLRVKDERLLTDVKLWRTGRLVNALLEACWVETLDPGPYRVGAGPNWDEVLQADRLYLFIQVRIASYGSEYAFRVACGGCGRLVDWTEDLGELPMVPVEPVALAAFAGGEPLAFALNGTQVFWRMFTGRDEQWILKAREHDPENIILRGMAHRILRLQSPEGTPIEGESRLIAWLGDLPAREADLFRDEIEAREGGIDLQLELDCPHCGANQTRLFPFDQNFFSARRRSSAFRTRRSGISSTLP